MDADRIHKFTLSDPTQELHLCAETADIMRAWIVGVAAVVSLQMPMFSIDEVGMWLQTNRLSSLIPAFRDYTIDGHKLVEFTTIDAIPPEAQAMAAEKDLATLVSRVQRVLGLDDEGMGSRRSVDVRQGASSTSGYDCVVVHRPEDAGVVDAMLQLFPPPADGLGEWKVFKSCLDTATSEAELEKHRELLRTTPNLLVMCTQGFFRRELDDAGREVLNPRLELVVEALEISRLNILCVYTWDFKIPKPSRLPESVRPILKLDFYKLDLEIHEVAVACTRRICSDFMTDRHGDAPPFDSQWHNIQQAVFACTEMDNPDAQCPCFAVLTHLSATLDGERQFYECHAVEAAAEALGCSVSRVKGGTILSQKTPVVHKELIKLILINFLMATFNKYDQVTRSAVIGIDGGIHALVGSLLQMQTSGSVSEGEVELLMLALVLCSRLGRNEPNMRKMRLLGTVKMARRCLTYNNRELRDMAEKTITEILNLDSTM